MVRTVATFHFEFLVLGINCIVCVRSPGELGGPAIMDVMRLYFVCI
eukprot:SAG25_NODE_1038_length_4211_cov_3.896158_4_plen_46_part_00